MPAHAPLWPEQYAFWLWNYPPFRWLVPVPGWIWPALAVLGYFAHTRVVASFGRVVRYTRALPDNIASRKAIRERGLKLLDDLHRAEYDRIIVVGHSLGALLAYDLVSYYWATHAASHTVTTAAADEFALLCTLERLRVPWQRKRTAPSAGPARPVSRSPAGFLSPPAHAAQARKKGRRRSPLADH